MGDNNEILGWIDSQKQIMRELAIQWARINTYTFNPEGLEKFSKALMDSFGVFNEEIKWEVMPPFMVINHHGEKEEKKLADAMVIAKRPEAAKQVLLVCHMDTVYPPDHHFQDIHVPEENKVIGPGITDAKGGIVVMLKALQAFERSPLAKEVGWKVIINADEETGSPSSHELLVEAAGKFDFGMVFEPCFSNGRLVGARKGSGNFTLVATGKSAHAGRNIDQGKNAIDALAKCVPLISGLHGKRKNLTVNAGVMHGGIAPNVVAEVATAVYNIRFSNDGDYDFVDKKIQGVIGTIARKTGVEITSHGRRSASPKPLSGKTLELFRYVRECGKGLGIEIAWEDSGGVCDGNRLQSAGLPTVDTLGVCGGAIHSDQEYVMVDSFVQRSKLAAVCLLKWAAGEWEI